MKMKKSPNLAGELLHLPGEAATAIAAKLGPADWRGRIVARGPVQTDSLRRLSLPPRLHSLGLVSAFLS